MQRCVQCLRSPAFGSLLRLDVKHIELLFASGRRTYFSNHVDGLPLKSINL